MRRNYQSIATVLIVNPEARYHWRFHVKNNVRNTDELQWWKYSSTAQLTLTLTLVPITLHYITFI